MTAMPSVLESSTALLGSKSIVMVGGEQVFRESYAGDDSGLWGRVSLNVVAEARRLIRGCGGV
jgi:hypothetical protein